MWRGPGALTWAIGVQDGRDVPDGSSKDSVIDLEKFLKTLPDGVDAKIASGGGRMYVTMDRYEVRSLVGADN